MSTIALILFLSGALLVAVLFILVSNQASRVERRQLEASHAREQQAERDIEAARRQRAELANKEAITVVDQRDSVTDRRFARSDAPAPFAADSRR